MAQTRRRQRGAGGCVSKPGEANVCVENPLAAPIALPPVRKTKEEVIAEIKANMLKVRNRLNQSKKNRNELRERGRTAYLAGNRMGAKSMLVRSKLREKAIDRNLQSEQFYKTMLTRLGNKKGGNPSTLNPVYGLAIPPGPVAPVVPQVAPIAVNVSTRNPLHVAAQTKTLREYYNTQIAAAEAKLEEVKKAIEGLPAAGTPAEIPTLRTALVKTVEIYNKQIADMKARRPVGGKR
jgi:hypothetical protein